MQKEMDQFRKQIESHSTMITNERIGEIKNIVWKKALVTLSSQPNPIEAMEFFNSVLIWWIELPGVMDIDINKESNTEVEKALERGNRISGKLRLTGYLNDAEVEELLQISLSLQFILNKALQNVGYFFKIANQEPRGLEQSLKIFESKGFKNAKRKVYNIPPE